jgi:glutamine synthetase
MVDGVWSGGTYVCWGTDNREAPVRLCNAFSPPSRNFEIKCLDGTANPYLAVASFISAGMDGVSKDIECQIQECGPEPETTAAIWARKTERSWNYREDAIDMGRCQIGLR